MRETQKTRREFLKTSAIGLVSLTTMSLLEKSANASWFLNFFKKPNKKIINSQIGEALEVIIKMQNQPAEKTKNKVLSIKTSLNENTDLRWVLKIKDSRKKTDKLTANSKQNFQEKNNYISPFPTLVLLPIGSFPKTLEERLLELNPNGSPKRRLTKPYKIDLYSPIATALINQRLAIFKRQKTGELKLTLPKKNAKKIAELSREKTLGSFKNRDFLDEIKSSIGENMYFWQRIDLYEQESPSRKIIQRYFDLEFTTTGLLEEEGKIFLIFKNPLIEDASGKKRGSLEKTIIFETKIYKPPFKENKSLLRELSKIEMQKKDLEGFEPFPNKDKISYSLGTNKRGNPVKIAQFAKKPDDLFKNPKKNGFIHMAGYMNGSTIPFRGICSYNLAGFTFNIYSHQGFYSDIHSFFEFEPSNHRKTEEFFNSLNKTIKQYQKRTRTNFSQRAKKLNAHDIKMWIDIANFNKTQKKQILNDLAGYILKIIRD